MFAMYRILLLRSGAVANSLLLRGLTTSFACGRLHTFRHKFSDTNWNDTFDDIINGIVAGWIDCSWL